MNVGDKGVLRSVLNLFFCFFYFHKEKAARSNGLKNKCPINITSLKESSLKTPRCEKVDELIEFAARPNGELHNYSRW